MSHRVAIYLAGCLTAATLHADVRLPALISDHMVLQADNPTPIWGWANPGESVTVTLDNASVSTTADQTGNWNVKLPPHPVGGPHQLQVKGNNSLTVNDVLIGEVWLGSGQSNMAMTVNRAKDFEQEEAAANFPQIRMFVVSSAAAQAAQADCQGSWLVCSPQTVARFSATAYFFGRELHQVLGVPVGLINSSVGGTPIESWISPEAQAASPELKPFFAATTSADAAFDPAQAKAKYERDLAAWQEAQKTARAAGKKAPKRPQDPLATRQRKGNVGGLFNGKIAPLVQYRIRGALWYQGEANSVPNKAPYYKHQLPLLVTDWRTRWGYEFPFAWVQLPNFGGPNRDWPTVREAMRESLKLPQTGMAIALDIGEERDIHPKNKQDVGKRLALWALGTVYGKSGPTSGPLPAGHERRGEAIAIRFRHADGGLMAKGGDLTGFEVAGTQGFQPAKATIAGDTVVVTSPEVASPTAVRYAWENNPQATLFNAAGLPASPFSVQVAP